MIRRRPQGFVAGAKLPRSNIVSVLEEAGFQPGHPILGAAMDDEKFDILWIIHALSSTDTDKPVLPLTALLPDGSDYGEVRPAPMRVDEIRRVWTRTRLTHWYLCGRLVYEGLWYLHRMPVHSCTMHVLFRPGYAGYMQIIPNRQKPTAENEFRWIDHPSRLPPSVGLPK
jgi:hypothetical protein